VVRNYIANSFVLLTGTRIN